MKTTDKLTAQNSEDSFTDFFTEEFTKEDFEKLKALRREVHRYPCLSGEEQATAERIRRFLKAYEPDRIIRELGGHGLAAVYDSGLKGPTIMFRAELDGLPIEEKTNLSYKSEIDGHAHSCGHDGHMTMIAGLAVMFHKQKPASGRVILLFQPAEETGEGAKRVIEDPKFQEIRPDKAFSLHNLPGHPLGEILVRDHTFSAASAGFMASFRGKPSHAAHPENGINPGLAIAKLIRKLEKLPTSMKTNDFCLTTLIYTRVGQRAFGTSAYTAKLYNTLRAFDREDFKKIKEKAIRISEKIARKHKLEFEADFTEEFAATVNDSECVNIIRDTAENLGLTQTELENPFRWSEDFGYFTKICPSAMFGLGSGLSQPQLHNESFDFPDGLIPVGVRMFHEISCHILGKPQKVVVHAG